MQIPPLSWYITHTRLRVQNDLPWAGHQSTVGSGLGGYFVKQIAGPELVFHNWNAAVELPLQMVPEHMCMKQAKGHQAGQLQRSPKLFVEDRIERRGNAVRLS
jgi:hypothetical protein